MKSNKFSLLIAILAMSAPFAAHSEDAAQASEAPVQELITIDIEHIIATGEFPNSIDANVRLFDWAVGELESNHLQLDELAITLAGIQVALNESADLEEKKGLRKRRDASLDQLVVIADKINILIELVTGAEAKFSELIIAASGLEKPENLEDQAPKAEVAPVPTAEPVQAIPAQ